MKYKTQIGRKPITGEVKFIIQTFLEIIRNLSITLMTSKKSIIFERKQILFELDRWTAVCSIEFILTIFNIYF